MKEILTLILWLCAVYSSATFAQDWFTADTMMDLGDTRIYNGQTLTRYTTRVENVRPTTAPDRAAERRRTRQLEWGTPSCQRLLNGGLWGTCTWSGVRIPADNCETLTPGGFDLRPGSTCTPRGIGATQDAFSSWLDVTMPHCYVLGYYSEPGQATSFTTPWGAINPSTLANSDGMGMCSHPARVPQECSIVLPDGGVIDFGIVGPNARASRQITGAVSCGGATTSTLAPAVVALGPGISVGLTSSVDSRRGLIDVGADLVAVGGAAGEYVGSAVLTVSPN